MENWLLLAPIGSVIALAFAGFLIMRIVKSPKGDEKMLGIQKAISEGANAYLQRQYTIVAMFFAAAFVILLALVKTGHLPAPVPFAFLTGGFFSGVCGFIGMKVATMANARTCEGAKHSLNSGLRVAFSSGAVMGFFVVGFGLLDLSVWYYLLDLVIYRHLAEVDRIEKIVTTMLSFGMGASMQALFARVGGGIYTKAADVGADLVGKVEAGIPEDDVRNPATVADNVGDNVGDVAGMGADLYESYVGSIVATMVLAVAAGLGMGGVVIPMAIATIGVLSSIIGTLLVKTEEKADQMTLLKALRKGVFSSAIVVAVAAFGLIYAVLGMEHIGIYFAILTGLVAGILIGLVTEYYTSDAYAPAKSIAKAGLTGAATVIIQGLGVGMVSTVIPVLVVVAAIMVSFLVAGGQTNFTLGLYGIGIAAVGMLSTLGITLATDCYGPVADNAGGIAQMSGQDPKVRERTDALDSLGNTTAATGKGFAIGSAALTALTLISAYRTDVGLLGYKINLAIDNPQMVAGLFIGSMLPFLFCAFCIRAVGNAAQAIVQEVRRQFREITGLMQGTAQADYGTCVKLCTAAAQKEMILPAVTALVAPIVVGLIFNVEGVVGLLTGALVSGFVLAVFMANAGGAWDNGKKYIEAGNFGGKGSDAHKAAVVGDTVGDPLKDTAGPSVNILIKLMSMVSVVFASFIVNYAIFK
ncbi:MAG: sodium-translocating pyrophosphatase [Candidatus Omnitrophica bacterium]|nr:sodium-translocating pyrophosphatase [Candidatus Omnitrophota bacterium]